MREAILYFLLGFSSGSVLYSRLLPQRLRAVDTVAQSDDGNPGAANAVRLAGWPVGLLCLSCDIAKGFLPVALAVRQMDTGSLWFAPVLAAPVLGHVLSPMLHGRGGKGIAVSFGALLALLPESDAVAALAAPYLVCSTVAPIQPHARRSVICAVAFGVTAALREPPPIAVGCALIAGSVMLRHLEEWNPLAGRGGL